MADYELQGPFTYLEHHLHDFDQFAIFDAQDIENDFAIPYDTFKHHFDFTKVVFYEVQKADY
jgi:hypothetical protein